MTSSATPDLLKQRHRAALCDLARDPAWWDVRAGLMLSDIAPAELASYAVQLRYEREAVELGYSKLQ